MCRELLHLMLQMHNELFKGGFRILFVKAQCNSMFYSSCLGWSCLLEGVNVPALLLILLAM